MNDKQQDTSPSMTYPSKGTFNRLFFKIPLFLWRTGMGPLLSHPALGGSRMLALTTRGRNSGQPRHTILSYAPAGGKDYVCSGWGERSDWVKNIQADPLVTIQVGRKQYAGTAYRVRDKVEFTTVAEGLFLTGGDSHFLPWLAAYGIDFELDDMIAKRDRLYIFGFNPVEESGPAPLATDLQWIWYLFAGLALMIIGVAVLI